MARTKEGCEKSKITKEIKECFGILEESNSVYNSLVEELYWQIIKLRECREKIDAANLVVDFEQGKQKMLIQNPLLKTYNDLIKNQGTTIKSLQAICNKDNKGNKDNDAKQLMEFLNSGKKQVRIGK